MKIICPLGFDLSRNIDGMVCVGRGTKMSCDRAIKLARNDPTNSTVVATAGKTGSKWSFVTMSEVMVTYMKKVAPTLAFQSYCAKSFNTFGEMQELARVVSTMHDVKIVLAVKDWHAPRARFLFKFWLWKYNCSHFPVQVSTYPQPVSNEILAQEYLVSWPRNLIRVAQSFFRKTP